LRIAECGLKIQITYHKSQVQGSAFNIQGFPFKTQHPKLKTAFKPVTDYGFIGMKEGMYDCKTRPGNVTLMEMFTPWIVLET
jgi:hypothetical protein